jgi:predicted Zn-dependent protease
LTLGQQLVQHDEQGRRRVPMRKTTIAVTALALAATAAVAQQARSISARDKAQGASAHPQLLAEFGGEYTGSQRGYVVGIGKKIAVQSGLSNSQNDFTVTLLNSPVNNAFAVPGGYVYITRQLVGLTNDEAELASVLGHEVGHVAARHSAKRNTRSILGQILSAGAGLLTGNDLIGQIVGYGAQLETLRFSRSQEYAADDLGIRYLRRACYDPLAAADMLDSLNRMSLVDAQLSGQNNSKTPTWASTHPNTADRVSRARKAARAVATSGIRNRDAFLSAINGMTYDDDPKQGIVNGRDFRHPALKLGFTAPAGYTLTNGTSAVTISGSGGQASFSSASFNGDLNAYIRQALSKLSSSGRIPDYGTPRSTTINGMAAAIATTRASTKSGQVDVTVVAYRYDPQTAYHFLLLAPAGSGIGPFQSLADSFRKLSDNEAAAVRGRKLAVITVGSGDTVASLSARMAYDRMKTERFLALNRLSSNAILRPGQKVKIVVMS